MPLVSIQIQSHKQQHQNHHIRYDKYDSQNAIALKLKEEKKKTLSYVKRHWLAAACVRSSLFSFSSSSFFSVSAWYELYMSFFSVCLSFTLFVRAFIPNAECYILLLLLLFSLLLLPLTLPLFSLSFSRSCRSVPKIKIVNK